MRPYNLLVVHWRDAYVTTDDDHHLEDGEHLTISVGWKVEETKEYLTLSHFYDGISNEFQSPYTSIPINMIKRIKKVKI